jgi:hypothetical protein
MRELMRPLQALMFFGFLFALGCTGAGTGDVSGTVTFEGKPVEHGSIAFIVESGQGPTRGSTITNGKYSATMVPVGTTKVVITAAKDMKQQQMSYDNKAPKVLTSDELLPPKYSDEKQTELRYEVQTGTHTKDFALTK